jgi:hypothetical protein
MLKRYAAALIAALMLSACASAPTRVALEPAIKQKLNEVKVLSLLSQDEVIVRPEAFGASVALGGGLIGAMIDSKVAEGRQSTVQEMMAPFYGAVDDFDYRPGFQQALSITLSADMPVKFAALESTSLIPLNQELGSRVAAMASGTGLMFLRTSYAFTSDFTRLNLVTYAEIKVPGAQPPLFMNTFFYQSKAHGGGGIESVKAWSSNHGVAYRAALNEATKEITRMLAMDLAASASDSAGAPKATLEKVDGPLRQPITGTVLATGADRKIVRNIAGNMYSLPQ